MKPEIGKRGTTYVEKWEDYRGLIILEDDQSPDILKIQI